MILLCYYGLRKWFIVKFVFTLFFFSLFYLQKNIYAILILFFSFFYVKREECSVWEFKCWRQVMSKIHVVCHRSCTGQCDQVRAVIRQSGINSLTGNTSCLCHATFHRSHRIVSVIIIISLSSINAPFSATRFE
jgi:hypothetical protein